jgi:hypothetical protein
MQEREGGGAAVAVAAASLWNTRRAVGEDQRFGVLVGQGGKQEKLASGQKSCSDMIERRVLTTHLVSIVLVSFQEEAGWQTMGKT